MRRCSQDKIRVFLILLHKCLRELFSPVRNVWECIGFVLGSIWTSSQQCFHKSSLSGCMRGSGKKSKPTKAMKLLQVKRLVKDGCMKLCSFRAGEAAFKNEG